MKKLSLLLLAIVGTVSMAMAQGYTKIDASSKVTFSIKAGMTGKADGTIKNPTGTISVNPKSGKSSSVKIKFDISSIKTGSDKRDAHILKPEYFDVKKYATINFTSTEITFNNGAGTMKGMLAMKGTAKSISFPFQYKVEGNKLIVDAKVSVDRLKFKVGEASFNIGDIADVVIHLVLTK